MTLGEQLRDWYNSFGHDGGEEAFLRLLAICNLKIYVYDHGWEGAQILVALDRETANRKLVDPDIERRREALETHNKLYYDPASSLYEPDRHNPHIGRADDLLAIREFVLQEYDIADGLEISTSGDN